jgi:hypothetical protein
MGKYLGRMAPVNPAASVTGKSAWRFKARGIAFLKKLYMDSRYNGGNKLSPYEHSPRTLAESDP